MKDTRYVKPVVASMTSPDQVYYTPRRFSVDEYFQLAEIGILNEDDRVELLEGEIVVMEPAGSEHEGHVSRLAYVFYEKLGRRALVRTEQPTILDTFNAPQPDLVLVRWRDDHYVHSHPLPGDILLAIEVSWSSVTADRRIKAPIYARTGISEYWIVDLRSSSVEVYREPTGRGYASFSRVGPDSVLRPLAFDDVEIRVEDILLL